MSSALVALSGGQDSATCLYWAKREYGTVAAVTFDYGQTHRVEIDAARKIAGMAAVPWTRLDLGPAFSQIAETTLTHAGAVTNHYAEEHELPPSFVPGRNLILLGYAAAFAAVRGLHQVVTGVCQNDAAGYPDCREDFITTLNATARLALGIKYRFQLEIAAPLVHSTKAETWALAAELDCVDVIRDHTHTCYLGDHERVHDWGYGCGRCAACHGRAAGYHLWQGSNCA